MVLSPQQINISVRSSNDNPVDEENFNTSLSTSHDMNTEVANKIVYTYARCGCIYDAREVFDWIRYKDLISTDAREYKDTRHESPGPLSHGPGTASLPLQHPGPGLWCLV